jgi:transposase
MRFVPIKSVEHQAVLSIHRVRQGFVTACTAQANQVRGLLAEFGVVLPKGISAVRNQLMGRIDPAANRLPGVFLELMRRLHEHFAALDRQVSELEGQIKQWHRNCKLSRRLEEIPAGGPVTATPLVTSIADARKFKNGRQLAAWLGLVPRQHSSGVQPTLLGISKRGDVYLRYLADSRHTGRDSGSNTSCKVEPLAEQFARATKSKYCCRRPGKQERDDNLGLARS